MDVGMLWFDNDNQADLVTKITRATTYYHKKYGQQPNLCFIHPCMMPLEDSGLKKKSNGKNGSGKDIKLEAGGVELRVSDSMLPNHFWIGIHRKKADVKTP
jgi:hypothetical protein